MSSRALRRPLAAALLILVMLSLSGTPLAATPARADGSASSAKTVRAADYDPDVANSPFPDLAVTVSQTEDLIQQGITVSWAGGKKSTPPNQQTGGANFLQIVQCWGDEPGSNGTRPDRTTCQYGGFNTPGASRWTDRNSDGEVASQDSAYTAPGAGWWEPSQTAIPFRSATGVSVASIVDGKKVANAPDLNNNEFFNKYTTNEISWAGSGADGSGMVKLEVQTVQQSPGLGCGTPVTASDGTQTGSPCWLVVIPRGEVDASGLSINQSGLFWETWKHHVAIRLGFKPAGRACALGSAERQLSGSELISGAMGQWQPQLCGLSDGAVFSLLTGAESDAALAANGTAEAPMAITSRALTADGVTDHLQYAPIALTGVSIGFAIDRLSSASGHVPADVLAKERQAFTTLKLTPRLLAKLLTASYTDALPQASDKSHLSGVRNLTRDPEFLSINDSSWTYMAIASVGVSDALVPLGRSDAARAVWTYILADADAKAFLNGKADPWGMKVNPYYSTNKKVNPTGTALALPRDDFPKADPTEFAGLEANSYADVVNLVTWRPYTSSLDASAYAVLRGDPLKLGAWDPNSVPAKYSKGDRALVGLQGVLGLTSTSAAARYQVVQASLRNPAGKFVSADEGSLLAAASAMTKSSTQPQVVSFEPSSAGAKSATKAYPLAMPVYAAVNPTMADADLRTSYASFISFAATDGQVPGTDDGELADGYAPIPAGWRTQSLAAASVIKAGGFPKPTPTPTSSASASPNPTAAASTADSAPSGSETDAPSGPLPSGTPSDELTGPVTPSDPTPGIATAVVPATAAVGLAAALGIPVTSRFRRRRL